MFGWQSKAVCQWMNPLEGCPCLTKLCTKNVRNHHWRRVSVVHCCLRLAPSGVASRKGAKHLVDAQAQLFTSGMPMSVGCKPVWSGRLAGHTPR